MLNFTFMAQAYQRMIIASNEVPVGYNLAAALASWTVLAGFFVLPGTFTSLKKQPTALGDLRVPEAVVNIPLLPLAGTCYFLGAAGLGILWSRFRSNYVWVLTHLFWQVDMYPGACINIDWIVGLVSSIARVAFSPSL